MRTHFLNWLLGLFGVAAQLLAGQEPVGGPAKEDLGQVLRLNWVVERGEPFVGEVVPLELWLEIEGGWREGRLAELLARPLDLSVEVQWSAPQGGELRSVAWPAAWQGEPGVRLALGGSEALARLEEVRGGGSAGEGGSGGEGANSGVGGGGNQESGGGAGEGLGAGLWQRFRLPFELRVEASGELVLPAAVVRMAVAERFETDFLGRRVPVGLVQRAVGGAALQLRVRELPLVGQPAEFAGLVGAFEIEARLASQEVRAGERLSLTLLLSGRGNLEAWQSPQLGGLEAWRDFHVVGALLEPETAVDQRAWTVELEPLVAGVAQVPPVTLAWFDPWRERYVQAATAALPLLWPDLPLSAAVGGDEPDLPPGVEVAGGPTGPIGRAPGANAADSGGASVPVVSGREGAVSAGKDRAGRSATGLPQANGAALGQGTGSRMDSGPGGPGKRPRLPLWLGVGLVGIGALALLLERLRWPADTAGATPVTRNALRTAGSGPGLRGPGGVSGSDRGGSGANSRGAPGPGAARSTGRESGQGPGPVRLPRRDPAAAVLASEPKLSPPRPPRPEDPLIAALCERLGTSESALHDPHLEARLCASGLAPETAARAAGCLRALTAARYGGPAAPDLGREFSALLEDLQRPSGAPQGRIQGN
jgi:hypothetical protein